MIFQKSRFTNLTYFGCVNMAYYISVAVGLYITSLDSFLNPDLHTCIYNRRPQLEQGSSKGSVFVVRLKREEAMKGKSNLSTKGASIT